MTDEADKARKTLIGIEIPRDELALRIAMPCLGMKCAPEKNATEALDELNKMSGAGLLMGESFRLAADQAVIYFHERIGAARQPT